MGEWYVEEVAGDTYVFDRDMPHAWSIPQGPPVFSLPGDHDEAMCAACLAHNADIATLQARAEAAEAKLARVVVIAKERSDE